MEHAIRIFGWVLVFTGALLFVVLGLKAAGTRRVGSTDEAMFSQDEIEEMEKERRRG